MPDDVMSAEPHDSQFFFVLLSMSDIFSDRVECMMMMIQRNGVVTTKILSPRTQTVSIITGKRQNHVSHKDKKKSSLILSVKLVCKLVIMSSNSVMTLLDSLVTVSSSVSSC